MLKGLLTIANNAKGKLWEYMWLCHCNQRMTFLFYSAGRLLSVLNSRSNSTVSDFCEKCKLMMKMWSKADIEKDAVRYQVAGHSRGGCWALNNLTECWWGRWAVDWTHILAQFVKGGYLFLSHAFKIDWSWTCPQHTPAAVLEYFPSKIPWL